MVYFLSCQFNFYIRRDTRDHLATDLFTEARDARLLQQCVTPSTKCTVVITRNRKDTGHESASFFLNHSSYAGVPIREIVNFQIDFFGFSKLAKLANIKAFQKTNSKNFASQKNRFRNPRRFSCSNWAKFLADFLHLHKPLTRRFSDQLLAWN